MTHRKWISASIFMLAIGLVAAFFLAANSGASALADSDNPETLREQAAALTAESSPEAQKNVELLHATRAVTAPLFIGVDDVTVPTYLIDPDTAGAFPQFTGSNIWGSAYDTDNQRILFNDGSTLYEWLPGGAVNQLGSIIAPGGGTLVVVALAYYNGSLYATRNIANEGVYMIDPGTLNATLIIDYEDADFDFGGLAIDPLTGDIYGLNDDITPYGSGLFLINMDGSATQIAPYPGGETDLDGLAISEEGRAYLVSDEPGFIYVYDFGLGDYVTPIPNPWTTAEIFSGAAWIADLEGPHVHLDKTVGTDPGACATVGYIEVPPGVDVTYCYEITNTGTVTLTQHDLVDSEVGSILSGFPYTLTPSASVFVTQTVYITESTTNSATWTAYNPGPTDTAADSDSATVVVRGPEIQLDKTVGTDPAVCAATDSISVSPGTDVTYCYQVTNLGLVPFTLHDLDDSEIGSILSGFAYTLTPGASVFVTTTVQITQTTTNTATWTAYNAGPTDIAAASDSATVIVPPIIEVAPGSLATTLFPDETTMLSLVISNTGDLDLNWQIGETAPALAPAQAARPEDLITDVSECARYESYAGREPAGYAEICLGGIPSPQISGGDGFRDPSDIAYALDLRFSNMVFHMLNDFPGQTVIGPNTQAIYAMDFDSSGTILYAIDNTSRDLGTLNLNIGTFSPIAPLSGVPGSDTVSGLTIDPLTNKAYITALDGSVMTLYSLDLVTGTATPIGSDASVPFMIDIAMGPQGVMYGHDISTDSIYTIDTSTGVATLVGPTGVNSNFAQGMDFDNTDGTLYAYTYQGGGANQYGTIDLATGALTPLAVSNPQGEFEGAVSVSGAPLECVNLGDIPWVSVTPTAGTTSGGTASTVQVTFDATNLAPGLYTGSLCISSNDPQNPYVVIPLSLTVKPFEIWLPLILKQ